uniref:Solute carrier family 25 member 40-like n=1 Tax=Ciona intestinalis TaxID=7719 RepID=F6QEH2_CIOIN|nr:solute carrier family 25 member 40-like [Ciona intestinalis]|eukprot:XP_002129093.1 solute carrier family 25 member 40-like [Ciona intestinalis]
MEITPTQQMISSCSGALITSLFVTPLDVIKIRLQAQQGSRKCFMYCNGLMDHMCYCVNGRTRWYSRPGNFNGTIHAMIKIAQNEGISSLWSGLSPTLVMAVPATVVYFTSYDQLKSKLAPIFHSYAPIMAGAIARGGTVTVISPLELIRTKMQSQQLSYRELTEVIKTSVRKSGFISLWRGWSATMLRDVPFSMMYWYMYEELKTRVNTSSLFLQSFISGFCAGTTAAIVTLPLDVVKTSRQIKLGEKEMLGLNGNGSVTTLGIMRNIINTSGTRGLFVGLLPRCAKIAPACAIMISSYELGKSFFRSSNQLASSERSRDFISIQDIGT